MSPKIVISEDGVRYPAAFAERHGIKAADTRESPSGADRTRTHAAIGTVVTDDAAGSVITSAAADSTSKTGVNQGLAAPVDAATAEAQAAADAGKGSIGTTGAPDNTGTTEDGADNGGTPAGDDGAAGDADGTAVKRSAPRARAASGK